MAKATSPRRVAREMALRVLYTVDVGKQPADDVLGETLEANEVDEAAAAFAKRLVDGTLKNRAEIDAVIDRIAVGFPTVRQTAVDRNILRLAAAEVLFQTSDAPPGAVVNEAVELAKKYSTGESGKFVNGVLGTLVREHTGETVPDVSDVADAPDDDTAETDDGEESDDTDDDASDSPARTEEPAPDA